MYFSYLVVLFYCHFIWFYLTCLNLINGNGNGKLWVLGLGRVIKAENDGRNYGLR